MQAIIVQRHRIEGWGFSLILHGLLLSAIVPVFRLLPVPIHPEPFRWNVVFVDSLRPDSAIDPVDDSSSAKEFHGTTEAETHSSVSPSTVVSRAPHQARRGNHRVAEESSDRRRLLAAPPPTFIAQPQPEVSPQMLSTTVTTSVTQETLPGEQPNTNMPAPPIGSVPSAQPMTPIEQELPSPPASLASDAPMALAQPKDIPPVSPPPAPAATSGEPSAPRTDYSWLQRAVSRRLEELKRLSRPSLDDSSKLKVLVKAVVSNTGELIEAEVVKSSGLNRIDQEAMTLVQRVFPMPLDHTLDRQQIVMRIPIIYSRD